MKKKYIPGYFFVAIACVLLSLTVKAQLPALATYAPQTGVKANTSHNSHIPEGAIEDISKRTLTSALWKKGNKVVACYSSSPINYKDQNGNWQPIHIALKSNSNGWEASEQINPCYFRKDRSTAISLGNGQEFEFNMNCTVNGTSYDQQLVSIDETNARINMGGSIHKGIEFINNGIESSYTFDKPLESGISVTEQVSFPEGCTFRPDNNKGKEVAGGWSGDYVLQSAEGKELARFYTPVCFDAAKRRCNAVYNLEQKDGKYFLTTSIPAAWLSTAKYPLILDPLVKGPIAAEVGDKLKGSCLVPSYSNDSLLVTIPGKITIYDLSLDYSYTTVSTITEVQDMNVGRFYFSTSCGATPVLYCDSAYPGTCYLVPNNDFHSWLTCCYPPSCNTQTFWLVAHLGRTVFPGCTDTTIVWHDEKDTYPFNYAAFITGYTDSLANWSVSPTTQCSNTCDLTLNATCEFGVPPYTVSHPWAKNDTVVGKYAGCISLENLKMKLKIPGCPFNCGSNDTITVPPPLLIDACNDTAKNIFPLNTKIILKPVPVISIKPDSAIICNGEPVSLTMSSCVNNTTYVWKGSDKSSGTTSPLTEVPVDTLKGAITITYTVTGAANGCNAADTLKPYAVVLPVPKVTAAASATNITEGDSDTLKATGGGNYSWVPTAGLSCSTCATTVATPTVTTMYHITVTDSGGCTAEDSVLILVKELSPPITIPNIITPNGDGKNDVFSIQNLQFYPNTVINIYDRWGRVVYTSNNYPNNWDGGGQSDGVYYYILTLPNSKKYKGFIQIIR
jgi:gliding motility-associated-like protein